MSGQMLKIRVRRSGRGVFLRDVFSGVRNSLKDRYWTLWIRTDTATVVLSEDDTLPRRVGKWSTVPFWRHGGKVRGTDSCADYYYLFGVHLTHGRMTYCRRQFRGSPLPETVVGTRCPTFYPLVLQGRTYPETGKRTTIHSTIYREVIFCLFTTKVFLNKRFQRDWICMSKPLLNLNVCVLFRLFTSLIGSPFFYRKQTLRVY